MTTHTNIKCTTLAPWIYADVCPHTIKAVHNSCNMCTSVLPDMCNLIPHPAALRTRVHISGRTFVPMLQLLHVHAYVYVCILAIFQINSKSNINVVTYFM